VTFNSLGIAVSCLLAVTISGCSDVVSGGASNSAPVEVHCDPPSVVVRSPYRAEALMACAGARDAESFLAGQGFAVGGEISIDVVHALPAVAGSSAAGCYLAQDNRVFVLGYAEFATGGWFEMPMEPALYRSLVAHEVAHAVAAANFEITNPAIQAHEYIAYVTMFATMAPALRERLLVRYPGEGYEDDGQMSSTILLFDPMRFGVQAYRHYLKSGSAYLHAVVAGRALVE
jgi:hypothetical protein